MLKVRASEVIGNPLANSYRVSEVIGNPLTNSPKDIGNFSKLHRFARGLPTHSNLWPEGIVRDGHGGGWSRKINAWHL